MQVKIKKKMIGWTGLENDFSAVLNKYSTEHEHSLNVEKSQGGS